MRDFRQERANEVKKTSGRERRRSIRTAEPAERPAYGMAIAWRALLEKAKTVAVRDPRLQSYFDSAEVISLNNQARAWAQ